ncbi:MAG: agmatinase [bacterium]|nr:agmatinase [bacterium]
MKPIRNLSDEASAKLDPQSIRQSFSEVGSGIRNFNLYRPPDNFLGLTESASNFATSRVVVLPIPYESTMSYRGGTKDGPRAILAASRYVETYDAEFDTEIYQIGIHTLPELDPDLDTVEKTITRIETAAQEIIAQDKFLIGLGGEHSVTLGLVKAYQKKYPKLSVVQLDAHADLRDRYEGTPFSHACVMRRIHDLGIPTVGVGIRSISQEEADYLKQAKRKATIYSPRIVKQNQTWISPIIATLRNPVYVTIDIDVFDPAFVPGTGTPEPGGLDWFEITNFLSTLSKKVDIVGFDVVELSPLGGQVVSEFLAARLVYKFINYLFAKT